MKRRDMLRRVLGAVALAYGVSRGPRVENSVGVGLMSPGRTVTVTGRNASGWIVTETVDIGEPLPPLERVLEIETGGTIVWFTPGFRCDGEEWRRDHQSFVNAREARAGGDA